MVAFTGQQTTVLQAFDVLPGNADMNGVEFHSSLPLGNLDCLANGVHRFFDVADYTAQHTDAFDLTDADNFEFAMGVFSAGQTTHFRRANVQGYDHIVGLMD